MGCPLALCLQQVQKLFQPALRHLVPELLVRLHQVLELLPEQALQRLELLPVLVLPPQERTGQQVPELLVQLGKRPEHS
ncbi:hypothetical protein AA106556_1139 [Neokomagataea tanensis NBRC 106556]|uniref:Transposase n=1 Tax=Neokomagataea tanensis NBRC 106556 TaxID=1223519 RepID=A0ABQ0QIZ5_9PROT|nr:hypothetical protein AA106556_1139 [Neokomagataea tanensis NBRC 106556]